MTRENQSLFCKSIMIEEKYLDVFTKGSSCMINDGNQCIMVTNSRSPIRFKGVMNTSVMGSDGCEYACDIEIGNIDFNIGDETPEIHDGIAFFRNIHAMIYPYGRYQAVVHRD